MLSAKNRLDKIDVRELREKKLPVLQGKFLGLVYKPSEEKKFSLVISSKISKKAVERNRIKRIFYKLLRDKFFDLKGKFLFLAKKNITQAREEELAEDLEDLVKKVQ